MKLCIKNLTTEQIIIFIIGILLFLLLIFTIEEKNTIISIFILGSMIILVIVAGINPNTLKEFLWSQNKDGQQISFNRHISSNEEIEKVISLSKKTENFKRIDLSNNKLLNEAKNRSLQQRSGADFLLLSINSWDEKKYNKALEFCYYGLLITSSDKVKSSLEACLGITYNSLNNKEYAFNYAKKSIETDSSNSLAYNAFGVVLNKNEKDEAIKMFRKAIELDVLYSNAYVNLALLLDSINLIDEAEELNKKAVDIDNNSNAYNNLGSIKLKLDLIDEAELMFRKSIKFNNKAKYAYFNLGRLLSKKENLEEAKEMFENAIKLDNKYSNAYNSFGLLLEKMNNTEEAKKMYKKAIEINNNKYSKNNLDKLLKNNN